MSPGRILAFVFMLFTASSCSATLLVDPFLEDMRVGKYRSVDDIEGEKGWPADLFASPNWSPGWVGAWRQAADPESSFLDSGLLTLLRAQSGDAYESAEAWIRTQTRIWSKRDSLVTDAKASVPAFLRKAVLTKRALDQSLTNPRDALQAIEALIAEGTGVQLDELERFVWTLRHLALTERLDQSNTHDRLWPELVELGSYDRASGWAVWSLRRLYLGLSLIPETPTDIETVLFLASLRKTGLTSRDIDRSPYSRDARSALGAATLPGTALRRHFGLYPDPPADERYQGHWLRGRWAQSGYTAEAAERLSALPGLAASHRASYLRRAADKQASSGYWGSVIPNLRAAHLMAARSGKRSVTRRVRIEIERMATLASYQGHEQAAHLLKDLEAASARKREIGRLGDLATLVSRGQAPHLKRDTEGQGPTHTNRRLWQVWAKLGLRLVKEQGGSDPFWKDYATNLGRAAEGKNRSQTDTLYRQAVALALRDHSSRDVILDWTLVRALVLHSSGWLVSEPTPILSLVGEAASDLEKHLLLGVAILLGDARGQLAAVVAMSRPGLSHDENLLLLYPVPNDGVLWTLINEAGLDPALVLAVARNESLFDPSVRSRSGALGWMQIMPFHYPGNGHYEGEVIWRSLGKSVEAGLKLLAQGIRRHDGDPYRTLADYNAGPKAVNRWDAQLGGGAPEATFLSWIGYPETRRYVEKVLIDREVYDWILEGVPIQPNTASETH